MRCCKNKKNSRKGKGSSEEKNEHVCSKGQNSSVEENNNNSQNEEPEDKSVNCRKRYVLKNVKEKKKNHEQQRRNLNRKLNVKNTELTKKLHVSSTFKKQNVANTLKSYAISNLCTKSKILQKVKILRQKQKAKRINVNRKSDALTQCLHVFNQKTSSGPIYVCTVCLQT